jgi:myo-inositol-1(or 4)-monophosphatase
MSNYLALAQLAADIAREAGELALQRRAKGITLAGTKSSIADIVTEADREVEALIRQRLLDARPGDGFLGEESGGSGEASGITWVVDPIDGTVNYARGIPLYCVSIAAVEAGTDPRAWKVVAGAVFVPVLQELYWASLGGGAFLGEQRMQVSTPDGPALLATGFGYDPSTHEGDIATVASVMPMARDVRRMGAAAIDLAAVAAGRLDGYFERGLQPWDWAAGSLLVTEAGGNFTRLDLASARPMTVAGNQKTHAGLLKKLNLAA